MFGIPEWAIGVGTIVVVMGVLRVVMIRLLPADYRRRRWKHWSLPESEDALVRREELDELNQRLAELEERVDFAERLLTRQRAAERMGPP